jgi:hypothetical protein
MNRSTALIRIRFPYDVVARLDRFAERLCVKSRQNVPRAALVRALVLMHMDNEGSQEVMAALRADPVKRGREKGSRGSRAPSI